MYLYSTSRYMNYAQLQAEFKTARNPNKGKPLAKWARLFQDDDFNMVIHAIGYGSQPLCTVSPENILTFVLPKDEFLKYSNTFTQALHRLIPFYPQRIRTNLYRMESTLTLVEVQKAAMATPTDFRSRWQAINERMKIAPEYVQGLQFDMTTGHCFNDRWKDAEEIPEKRTEWRRNLKQFKTGLKVRAKLNIIDKHIDDDWAKRTSAPLGAALLQPQWNDDAWVTLLANAIEKQDYPAELMEGFVRSVRVSSWRPTKPSKELVLRAADKVLSNLSLSLRRKLGVIQPKESQ